MTELDARSAKKARGPVGQGEMTLVEHLRELRTRLVKAVLALLIGAVLGYIFYNRLFHLLEQPFRDLQPFARRRGLNIDLVFDGITSPFFLQLKLSLVAGVVLSSPVWLYQLWAFIVPGLHRHERRWTLAFIFSAIPLFLVGVVAAWEVLPKGLQILLSFTPANSAAGNLIRFDTYLDFVMRMILVFGLGFELPVFMVLLNLVGVLPSSKIRKIRTYAWFGILVFAAVATPTGDPLTMLLLGVPIILLYEVAAFIAFLLDRRRRQQAVDLGLEGLDDDVTSPLDDRPSRLDDRPSRLDDDVL